MLETEMAPLSTPQLRHREASYFCSQFIAHCGPPHDSYFHMVCYFDAFLAALTSVEEMVDNSSKATLAGNDAFRFIKALRNITTHHSVLASSQQDSKFTRPFTRHLFNSVGNIQTSSGNLAINYARFREIFDAIEIKRPSEKHTIAAARRHLAALEAQPQPVFLEQVMHEALAIVEAVVA